ncbi:hypothetical protein MNBD_GAMMA03-366 [hydrothermal vent metagenome]|uniref:Lipoprotein n=1 Tax=hydrothermal vent metagenome TaxID=652676 RepID=A0A3B0WBA7_9ZZZZ
MIQFKKIDIILMVKRSFLTFSFIFLLGCSGIVDRTGQALISAGDSFQSVIRDVQVIQVDENTYDLMEAFYEPVKGFDSWALRAKAKEMCHEGYIYKSRHAAKKGAFGQDHAQCVEGQACRYVLEWRIQCKQVPYEPFSLFGKT